MQAGWFATGVVQMWNRKGGAIFPERCPAWAKKAGTWLAKKRYKNMYLQILVWDWEKVIGESSLGTRTAGGRGLLKAFLQPSGALQQGLFYAVGKTRN